MPYIAIKGFPKDDETVRKVAERINAVLLDLWGCRQEHINISYEAVPPEEWDERIEHGEIVQNWDKMLILGGKWTSREKKLTILHLDDCPYCHKARRALNELHDGDARSHDAGPQHGRAGGKGVRSPAACDKRRQEDRYGDGGAGIAGQERLDAVRCSEMRTCCRSRRVVNESKLLEPFFSNEYITAVTKEFSPRGIER